MIKPNILVVHGALGAAVQMEPIARALDSLGAVDNVELLGHGNSPTPAEDFSMTAFVHQLHQRAEYARSSGDQAPLVFGYSMGGYAALAVEAAYPGTFSGIVTLGTKFAWTPALALHEGGRLDAGIISEKIPKFANTLEERHHGAGGWKTVLERTAAMLVQLGATPLLTPESLRRIHANVCIVVGEKDDTVSADEAREYASHIPDATTRVIVDVPHPIERVPVDAIVQLMRSVDEMRRSSDGL